METQPVDPDTEVHGETADRSLSEKSDAARTDEKPDSKTDPDNSSRVPVERKKSGDSPKSKSIRPSLTTQQSMSDAKLLYKKAFQGVKKTRSLLKESPLALISLVRKQGSTRQETLEQTIVLVEEYIYSRLIHLLPSAEERETIAEKNMAELTEVSRELQLIGHRLESTYPHLYENISSQVNMPNFKTEAAIRRVLSCVGDTMFKNGHVTWCRLVAMFAVSAGVAVECVKHSKTEVVCHCVAALTEVLDRYAVDWVMEQGGWVDLTREYRVITNEARTLWALSGIGASIGFAILWVLTQSL